MMYKILSKVFMKLCIYGIICLVLSDVVSSKIADKASLQFSTQDLLLSVNSRAEFSVSLSDAVNYPVSVSFNYTEGRCIHDLPNNLTIANHTHQVLNYTVQTIKAGHTIVNAYTDVSTDEIDTKSAFIRIASYKDDNLVLFSSIIGWLYFVAWSVSFYPQIIDNWRRKSVVGLNFDFLGLNLTGFLAYSVFNIGLRYNEVVKSEYHILNPTGIIPVEVNDVVFAVHATIATLVTIGQCFIYERGNQLIAKTTVAILALVWSTAGVFLLITSLGINKYVPWLTYLYFFSYVKLLVTLTKYIPQVVYNYKRKSTVGWSIGTVLLDFVGGVFSIMQMFIIAYNFDDWNSIFGNLTKFGLGLASIMFDVIFMVQHYCLYRNGKATSSENLIPKSP